MPALTPNGRLPGLKTAPAFGAERVRMHLRTRFNPIRNLTPESLTTQLDNFKAGYLREFALTAETIEERDDVLKSVVPKRKKSVSRHSYEIMMMDDSPEAARHKEALEYFYAHLSCTHALDLNERGSFKLLVRQMLDAVAKRYAVHEIVWKPGGTSSTSSLTAEFRFVPLWFFENRTGRLRFLRQEFDVDGVELEEGGWMVTVGDGLMVASAVAWMYKRLPLQDWLNLSEKFGIPGLLGKTAAAKDSAEWDDMVTALTEFSSNWAAVVNEGAQIDLIETKASGQAPQEPLVERMDRALARLWRGADLSTLSKGEGVGASLQGDESNLIEEDDAELIGETLNLYVDPYVIQYQFGAGVTPLAYLKIVIPNKTNIDAEIKVDTFLRDSGAPLAVSDTLERYGRPTPDATEPLLTNLGGTSSTSSLTSDLPNEQASAELVRRSQDALARAVAEDLQPIRSRLERILQIADPDVLASRLRAFLDELPRLLKSVNADPAAAQALEGSLSAALINGLTIKTQA